MKKNLTISDPHCGHKIGLTPPGWVSESRLPWQIANRAYWAWWEYKVKSLGPFDNIFVNGDCIDGKGSKSGGVELITTDREEQADMAIKIIRGIPKKRGCKIIITRGTPYHTGEAEDWENKIAGAVDAKIGEHEWVEIEGVVFDLKHHPAGGSQVPHGRHTAVARDRLWNVMWAERNMQPKADVFIRSHVHYHNYSGGPGWLAITTPALQGSGSRYGARRCSGLVDFGFLTFEIHKGNYSWQAHIAELEEQRATLIKL